MSFKLEVCAIAGQLGESRVADCAAVLANELQRHGLRVLIATDDDSEVLPGVPRVPRAELPQQVDLLFSIGGDGTLLQSARLVAPFNVPLMGINRGRLGFLTDVLPQEMAGCVEALLEGRCIADRRSLLEGRLVRARGDVTLDALNDVVLLRRETGRMLDFETWVDGRQLNSHSGDGLIIATATGSTAYALSCGGPIVDPRLNVLLMVPICPHTLSDRPIVVPGDAQVEINLIAQGEGRADVTCDGAALGDMEPGDCLQISTGGRQVTLMHPPGYDYFRLLRSKLRWGRGADQHER